MLTGQCQCGAVGNECMGEPLALHVFHCRERQRQSASAFGMSLQVPRAALRLVRGAPAFWSRGADSGRRVRCAFCPDCGACLWHEPEPGGRTAPIKAGSLERPVADGAAGRA